MTVEEKRKTLIEEGYNAPKWSDKKVEREYSRLMEENPIYMDFLKKVSEYRCLQGTLKALTSDKEANSDLVSSIAGVYYCNTKKEEKEIRQKMSGLWDKLKCHPYLNTCSASVSIHL